MYPSKDAAVVLLWLLHTDNILVLRMRQRHDQKTGTAVLGECRRTMHVTTSALPSSFSPSSSTILMRRQQQQQTASAPGTPTKTTAKRAKESGASSPKLLSCYYGEVCSATYVTHQWRLAARLEQHNYAYDTGGGMEPGHHCLIGDWWYSRNGQEVNCCRVALLSSVEPYSVSLTRGHSRIRR